MLFERIVFTWVSNLAENLKSCGKYRDKYVSNLAGWQDDLNPKKASFWCHLLFCGSAHGDSGGLMDVEIRLPSWNKG